ncbi:MAG: type II secretion system protein GspM [Pseudomonadota bacterium]
MRLNSREKVVVGAGLLVALIVAVFFLVVDPLDQGRDQLRRRAEKLKNDLQEMHYLAAQYQALSVGRDQFQKQVQARGGDFAPFSYLENIARESGLTGQIESMTPVAAGMNEDGPKMAEIDIRLAGIGLGELTRFLYRLETSEKVFFVVNLNIRPRYLTPRQLDVTVRLASPLAS